MIKTFEQFERAEGSRRPVSTELPGRAETFYQYKNRVKDYKPHDEFDEEIERMIENAQEDMDWMIEKSSTGRGIPVDEMISMCETWTDRLYYYYVELGKRGGSNESLWSLLNQYMNYLIHGVSIAGDDLEEKNKKGAITFYTGMIKFLEEHGLESHELCDRYRNKIKKLKSLL